MRVRINRGFITSRLGLAVLGALALVLFTAGGVFIYYWVTYGRMIDERLSGHVNQTTARIYTAPQQISTGEVLPESDLVDSLQHAGYGQSKVEASPGWYAESGSSIEIHPERESYFNGKNALRVDFAGNKIRQIRLLDDGSVQTTAEIEPELLTNLFDSSREKRRKVRFNDIPKVLVDALLSAEDKRFFEHPGFDLVRIVGAAWADVRHDGKAQGASTLTMQVARSFFFTTERTWRRKIAETMVSLELEHRFTKDQIFELYANEIYLGNRGSFSIHGFAEGSLAYFSKDIRDLSLNEAAFLTGIIRAPNRYSTADRRPERAAEARDRVLNQMAENKFITVQEARDAKKAPLRLTPGGFGNSDAPYFVDMVKDDLLDHFSEAELLSQSFRVYTTLDPVLERDAAEAVTVGIGNVDQQLARRYARWAKAAKAAATGKNGTKGEITQMPPPALAQVAMVVLDPHTGEIRAVIGGRDYSQSQLNHALARRQPGSVFKPFVYAAAFDSAVDGVAPIITPATTVMDEPTTFQFDGKEYTPNNYGEEFKGEVTLREALTRSLNVATVKLAEMIGYARVVQMARHLGLDDDIQATPAVALGAYEMTPVEVAAGYTAFANGGMRAEPMYIEKVVNADGIVIESNSVKTKQVLDPRVAYQITSVLEDVVNRGTGATVRARGFQGVAAGKTGTSRDGWFAGYTSNLLCIVWVGFDDNRDLGLSGATTAAPIWAEFMKRATADPAYHDLKEFDAPAGVTVVNIDPETQQLATPSCPVTREEVYITGTEPTEFCQKHGGGMLTQTPPGSWFSRIFGGGVGGRAKPEDSVVAPAAGVPAKPGIRPAPAPAPAAPANEENGAPNAEGQGTENKKGVLHRIFGIFGGKDEQEKPKSPAN